MSEVMGKRQKSLGEFPIPQSAKELPKKMEVPDGMPVEDGSPAAEEKVTTPEVKEFDGLEITEENRDDFLEAILFEKEYVETIELFGGKLKATLRTRWVTESDKILRYVRDSQPEAILDVELAMSKANLAYALVKLEATSDKETKTEIFDVPEKTFEERVARIGDFPVPKYTALMEILARFDRKISRLQRESLGPDFLQAGGGR